MTDKIHLICKPVSEGAAALPSTTTFCSACGQSVWISEDEYRPGIPTGYEPICSGCGLQQMITTDKDVDITIPQEQRDKLISMGYSDIDLETIIERMREIIKSGKQLRNLHE